MYSNPSYTIKINVSLSDINLLAGRILCGGCVIKPSKRGPLHASSTASGCRCASYLCHLSTRWLRAFCGRWREACNQVRGVDPFLWRLHTFSLVRCSRNILRLKGVTMFVFITYISLLFVYSGALLQVHTIRIHLYLVYSNYQRCLYLSCTVLVLA